ncbi:hypothetical protein FOT21_22575 [Escherichia coli]|nr:hypothetical protein [Escherichia coli]
MFPRYSYRTSLLLATPAGHRQDTGRLWSASDVPVARQTIASREMLKTKAHPSALAHVARKYC